MKEIKVILIVDDETSILKSYARRLQREFDVTVLAAENLTEMLKKASEMPPDLVLMDGLIGPESGVDAMKRLRESGFNSVVITHSNTQHLVEAMLALGAIGSLEKPPVTTLSDELEAILQDAAFSIKRTSR